MMVTQAFISIEKLQCDEQYGI